VHSEPNDESRGAANVVALKTLARTVVMSASTLLVFPALCSFWLRARLLGRDRALEASTQTLALLPGIPGRYLRKAFLSHVLAGFDQSATIEFGTLFSKADARIDENVYVGPRCHLGLVHIERNVLLGAGVHVPSGGHLHGTSDPSIPIRDQRGNPRMVRIGAGCWIGSAAVVMADVGPNTVIGAGSVVTRPIPGGVVAGGVPARVLRSRTGATILSPHGS
jgi:acetyltransferase-like isoleucine patch superfamily enzyme